MLKYTGPLIVYINFYRSMRHDVKMSKPIVLQLDTTFGVSREGYKLNVPTHRFEGFIYMFIIYKLTL